MLRGLPLVQIPTTLLAQLDSSVGGKTAVNLPQGKNLVGAVYQPRLVLADPDCLSTLPPRQLSVGAAEAIKMGFAADESILRELESDTPRWETVIAAAVAAKAAVVAADEWDKGRRQILNFGHTLGHVYEAAGGCLHGEAVAAGMMKMLELEERWGEPTAALRERLAALLRRYELPAELPCGAETYRRYLPLDKKCRDGVITLVQVRRCGRTELRKMDVEALLEALAACAGLGSRRSCRLTSPRSSGLQVSLRRRPPKPSRSTSARPRATNWRNRVRHSTSEKPLPTPNTARC